MLKSVTREVSDTPGKVPSLRQKYCAATRHTGIKLELIPAQPCLLTARRFHQQKEWPPLFLHQSSLTL